MFWCFLFVFLTGLVVSYLTCFMIRAKAIRWGLVDKPGHRKIHVNTMPTDGGLAIWFAIVAPLAIAQIVLWGLAWDRTDAQIIFPLPDFIETHLPGLVQQSKKLWIWLGFGTVLVALGLWDDFRGLSWKLRIGVQFLVAMGIVACGWRASFFLEIPWLTYWLSVFWVIGLINSFNMLDNMDALSAGVATICAAFFALIMLLFPSPETQQPQLFIGGFMLLFAGAMLGFLGHNHPPARLFMGDSGAYFIGYLLATATLSATFTGYDCQRQTIFVPLTILALPLYDTISVVLIRLKEGRSPFVGDKSHFSHRLVDLGFTKPQAVCVIYLVTTICCIGAVLLYHVQIMGACLLFLQVLLVLILVAIIESVKRKK